jgi:two-component system NtrC family response regulator
MCTGRLIEGEDLELESRIPKQLTLKDSRDESDRRTIVDALRFTSGNVSRAAELLGISRPSLHELLTKLHINAQNFRLPPGKKGE